MGFSSVLIGCVASPDCSEEHPFKHDEIDAIQDDLEALYALVKAEVTAEDAQVVVFAYPQLFSPAGTTFPCLGDEGFNSVERTWIRSLISHLNDVIEQAANNVGIDYVPLNGSASDGGPTADPQSFDTHEICSSEEWINGHVFSNPADPENLRFHPNALGHQEEAQRLMQIWEGND